MELYTPMDRSGHTRVARDEGVVEGGDEGAGGLAQVHGIEVATPRPEVERVKAFVKLLPRLIRNIKKESMVKLQTSTSDYLLKNNCFD